MPTVSPPGDEERQIYISGIQGDWLDASWWTASDWSEGAYASWR